MDSNLKSVNPNKQLKEQFVSNLTGSSMLELFVVITAFSSLILLRRTFGCNITVGPNAAESSMKKNDEVVGNKSQRAFVAVMVVDFLFILVPFTLLLTVLSKWIYMITTLLILLLLISFSARRFRSSSFQESGVFSFRTNVSSYRVAMGNCCRCLPHACVFWLSTSKYFPENMLKQRLMALV